jgi:elongator complex protein 3
MLSYGATRVELGVQHPDDRIYETVKRGHDVRDVVAATKILKDSAFKVLYHIMPGLPGSNPKKDIAMVKKLFSDERFRPDMLKIYPTLVMPGTQLHGMMKRGEYAPYSSEKAADAISEFYRYIPKYVRVMRIQRDIPSGLIADGAKKSNLRELVEQNVKEKKIRSEEIRSREIGLLGREFVGSEFRLRRFGYDASGGTEIFLSSEDNGGLLAGFLRLRLPGESCRKEIDRRTALIRELHVYGKEVAIQKTGNLKLGTVIAQHMGIGSELLSEAERIAGEEFHKKKMIVISGIGAREYYRGKGYKLVEAYMRKKL